MIKSFNPIVVFRQVLAIAISSLLSISCSELLETDPDQVTDTSDVIITCDATLGNKGLLDYEGDVYVHVGLITSKSEHKDDWRHVKFAWGSREIEARATPSGRNKWAYSIKNVREFFGVGEDERIVSMAILFRSGACIDVYCKVLRNADESNIYIPINDLSSIR